MQPCKWIKPGSDAMLPLNAFQMRHHFANDRLTARAYINRLPKVLDKQADAVGHEFLLDERSFPSIVLFDVF